MKLCLAMQTTDGGERVFALKEERTVLGRGSKCDVRISVPDVADRHCEIEVGQDGAEVLDLDTEAGTFLNGRPVRHARLDVNDRLKIGPVTFVVRVDVAGLPTH